MAILDHRGRPIPPGRPPRGEAAPTSSGGILAPFVGEIPPDPRVTARYAAAGQDDGYVLQIYRDALRDERVAAALDQRLDAAVSTQWEVEPGGDRARDRRAAEALKRQLGEIEFDAACRQLLMAQYFGYAWAECIWAPGPGGVRLADLRVRAPDRIRWREDGAPMLRTYSDPLGQPLPPHKFIFVKRPGEHADQHHGVGLANWIFWPAWIKRNGLRFWSIALEKYGSPNIVGKYNRGAGKAEQDRLLELIQGLANGSAITTTEDTIIEILESTRRTGGDFAAFIEHLERAITTTLLGQSSTTDQGPWRGTAEVQKDVRDETVAADCRLLDRALNTTLCVWLTAWNFPGAAPPRIRRDTDPPEDLAERAKIEEIVARTSGLRPTARHVEETYGGEWEDAPAAPPQGAANEQSAPPQGAPDDESAPDGGADGDGAAPSAPARAAREPDDVDEAEEAAQAAADDWRALAGPVIDPVLAAAVEADDFAAFKARLDSPELYEAMDDAALVERLRRALFSAQISAES